MIMTSHVFILSSLPRVSEPWFFQLVIVGDRLVARITLAHVGSAEDAPSGAGGVEVLDRSAMRRQLRDRCEGIGLSRKPVNYVLVPRGGVVALPPRGVIGRDRVITNDVVPAHVAHVVFPSVHDLLSVKALVIHPLSFRHGVRGYCDRFTSNDMFSFRGLGSVNPRMVMEIVNGGMGRGRP